ncbi:DNA repair protein RecO [Chloroflexota bacterium]
MTRPRAYKTEAIVLKRMVQGEADSIFTLYTPNLGKIRVVARGVRKPKSKLGGHLEPLTCSALVLAKGQNLDIITQAQTIEPFLPLRNDLWRTGCSLYAAELVDQFCAEQVENYHIYKLLHSTFLWLCEAPAAELVLRTFDLHLLSYLGYRPEFYQCVNCRAKLEPKRNLFSASGGGVLCPACGQTDLVAQPISTDAIKVMRFLLNQERSSSRRLRMSQELSWELEQLLRVYIRYLLEREVKSVEFLDRLRSSSYFLRSTT